jgi:predicted nucleotidyltransferase
MNNLQAIFYSKVRAEVFRLLFGLKAERTYLNAMIGVTGFASRSLEEELAKLRKLELIVAARDGNRVYYSANQTHPLYPEIRNIVLKTTGLKDVLASALKSDLIDHAFVFGSFARMSERAGSDVDLMIIGRLTNRELAVLLRGVAEQLGREINPHIFNQEELTRRLTNRDHFL